jgi:hypothetical protein
LVIGINKLLSVAEFIYIQRTEEMSSMGTRHGKVFRFSLFGHKHKDKKFNPVSSEGWLWTGLLEELLPHHEESGANYF